MVKGLAKVVNNLKKIQNSAIDIDTLFIRKSLEWIRDRANINLDNRSTHFWGSEARLWNIKIYATYGILENQDMNSGAIEFGIGLEGAKSDLSEYNRTYSDIDSRYAYDLPSEYKDDKGYWTFHDARTDRWLTFRGYMGKSFLYDALMEYKQNKMWVKLYQEAFDEIMRSIIK